VAFVGLGDSLLLLVWQLRGNTMLPTMKPVYKSRTKRARAMKAFEEVRVGSARLYFSHFELIGFQLDGEPPVVCEPQRPYTLDTAHHVDENRLHLEPDQAKWSTLSAFEKKWREIRKMLF
jgi:hypothetical protein